MVSMTAGDLYILMREKSNPPTLSSGGADIPTHTNLCVNGFYGSSYLSMF